jgi:hypothetical protein
MADSEDLGRVPTAPGSREPSPSVSAASGFDPSRIRELIEEAITEVEGGYHQSAVASLREALAIVGR